MAGETTAERLTDLFTGAAATPQGLGHFVTALSIEPFMPVDVFKWRMDARIRAIKQSERLPGVDEILMPGERELRLERERRQRGIPLGVNVLDQVAAVAAELGVTSRV